MNISGTFTVNLTPVDNEQFSQLNGSGDQQFGHLSLDKLFDGPLKATSKGQMLSVRSSTAGSAGYVAIEQVTGELESKSGSFVLQHYGTMASGNDFLVLEVVPDSGTGELQGLSGKCKLR
jgi:hypothetical protein